MLRINKDLRETIEEMLEELVKSNSVITPKKAQRVLSICLSSYVVHESVFTQASYVTENNLENFLDHEVVK